MNKNISLIDFGAGNLHSVYKAFKFIGANTEITKDLKQIEKSDAVILPGVGAFGAVMDSIRRNNLEEIIIKSAKKPFLGICVGMQVLFEEGEENPGIKGLGILKGKVVRFKKAKKIPHIGWNDVTQYDTEKFYFIHSYYVIPEDKNLIYGETEYDGEKFTSVIKKDNLFAVQFHPEKSGEGGLDLLKEFIKSI
ncbi:MAG: imidazole glycerol phosphate synthase subunit HisH [Candidatus Melainabacteria bacterium]|nr:imidazole glycerol phosphate synthase subunit HisH [Candidatus Melainabacteria bacterium]